ncbi:GNAT family N-acetyltransferase [Soehngenia saccharolytica]|nr:GNAT family N-acetyltransferase [Soehngenia saccharolytica]
MKVIILTEGGKNIGLGHLSRCIALYDEIQSRNIKVELIVHGEVSNIRILEGKAYKNVDWANIEYLDNTISDEDYVIVDSYLANYVCYETISLKSKRALYIDDIGRLSYPKGIVLNPSLDSSHIDYSYKTEAEVLKGAKYVILRSAFCVDDEKILNKNVSRGLIIMGGTDIRNLTPILIKYICEKNPDINFDIVVDAFQYSKLVSLNKINNVLYHKDLTEIDMYKIIYNADIAISAAGQTIYELLSTRTPFIAIQVAENQKNNFESLKEYLNSEILLNYDEDNFIMKLQEKFFYLKKYENRKKISKDMEYVIDKKGRKRIIDALLGNIINTEEIFLRKAQKKDVIDVFEISNEDLVRQYSINKNKISWKDHVEWFFNVLESENTVFYVVVDNMNSVLGQIRFKLEGNSAIISISLANKLRGRGYSKSILKQGIDKLLSENNQVMDIIAYVLENNIVSIMLFTSLNFEEIDKNGNVVKFILRRVDYENKALQYR